LRDEICRY